MGDQIGKTDGNISDGKPENVITGENIYVKSMHDTINGDSLERNNLSGDKEVQSGGKVENEDIKEEINAGCETSSVSTDDEADDEADDGEDDGEDDEPPLLKYTRITRLPSSLFSRDSISACMFHDDFFIFGTHSGLLHLTKTDFTPIHTVKCHRSSILSIYTEGSYFATASIDGTVVIGLVDDPSNVTAFDFKRPVQAVVLDRDYKTSRTFVSGGMAGEVILSQRNWLGNRMDIILAKGHGPIVGIYTMDDIILWMNDDGITFCSIHSKAKLLNVPFPQNGLNEVRPDLYRPHVHFPEVDRIVVGWGNYLWMFKVSLAKSLEQNSNLGSILSSAASSLRAIPDRKVELEHHFSIKMYIAGVSSFKDDQLMCLGFSQSENNSFSNNMPEIKIIDALSGEDIHNDEVVFKNYKNLTLNDYHLGKHLEISSPEYFLISASDAIRVQVLTLEDHYKWHISKQEFMQAWKVGNYVVDNYERLETGLKGVEKSLEANNWEDAVSKLIFIIGNTSVDDDQSFKEFAISKWKDILIRVIRSGKASLFAHRLPLEPQFDEVVYNEVLEFYLKNEDVKSFISLIKKWPTRFFSIRHFEDELEEYIETHDLNENSYREAIIYLYLSQSRYSKAIPHMLKIKDLRVLDLLLSHSLIAQFRDNIIQIILLPYDDDLEELSNLPLDEVKKIFNKSIELLVQNRHNLKISNIVELLSNSKGLNVLLFLYLEQISLIDPIACAPFENKLIELYARFSKKKLLQFLKVKSNYDTEKAIEFCSKQHGLSNELIYLWGKIGENKKALSLIIDDLNDPYLAIDFVKNWGDAELWDFMIGYSMDKPKFVKALLDSPDEFGKAYLGVIKAMPRDMEIDGLQQTLSRICKDNTLNLRVRKNVLKIVDDETTEICDSFLKIRTLGKIFDVDSQ